MHIDPDADYGVSEILNKAKDIRRQEGRKAPGIAVKFEGVIF